MTSHERVSGPEIVFRGPERFVGMHARFRHALSERANPGEVIPPLWHRFAPRAGEVLGARPDLSFGLLYRDGPGGDDPDELDYLACVMTEGGGGKVPEGMLERRLPASKYARFTIRGPVRDIGKACVAMYREWLPTSGFEHAGIADIEVYGDDFDPVGDDAAMEYWISIKASEG